MPQFAPGEVKIAIAPITVSPAGLSCLVEVFLGPNDTTKVATSGWIPFVSTGVSQSIRLPITMPLTKGTYHCYIDVYAESIWVAAYQAIEDVVIAAAPGVFAYVSDIRFVTLGYPADYPYVRAEVDVQNQGAVAGVCSCCLCDYIFTAPPFKCDESYCPVRRAIEPHLLSATLQPGEIKTLYGTLWYRKGMITVTDWWAKFEGSPGEIYGKAG